MSGMWEEIRRGISCPQVRGPEASSWGPSLPWERPRDTACNADSRKGLLAHFWLPSYLAQQLEKANWG